MDSLELFRTEAVKLTRTAVLGSSVLQTSTVGIPLSIFLDDSVLPGEKIFQVRVNSFFEEQEDANVIFEHATCEIEVIRALHLRELLTDEFLYIDQEMLFNQSNLMDPLTWRALPSVDGVIDGPAMESVAEREGNIIRYTVAVSVRIAV